MNAKIKKTDNQNIRSEISLLKKSLLNLRFQKSTGQLEKTSEIKKEFDESKIPKIYRSIRKNFSN